MAKPQKQRVDLFLVEKGLVSSRSLAQRMVMAGQIRVNGQIVVKASTKVAENSQVEIIQRPRYVSRGGEKLEYALKSFGIDVKGRICADAGASTGGFTDCLLQFGAVKVYSIDVGQGILDWKLRQDDRVVVMERTNVRFIQNLPEPIDLVTIDASFISLKLLLPVVSKWLADKNGEIIALIKPQYEAGRKEVSRGGGVIRDPKVHRKVLLDILGFAQGEALSILGLTRSPLLGPKGNVEFLCWFLNRPGECQPEIEDFVEGVVGL